MPAVGEVPFLPFTCFVAVLLSFTCFMDFVLVSVLIRAGQRGIPLPTQVAICNYLWMVLQFCLFVDLGRSYWYYYRRQESTNRPAIRGSTFPQPRCWTYTFKLLGMELNTRSYLLWLALLLPMNALFFHGEIAQPVFHYGRPWADNMESRLSNYDVHALLSGWPSGGGLEINEATGAMTLSNGDPFDPPLVITSKYCYATDSGEFLILGRLQEESFPKQAFCETLIGTLMVDGQVASNFHRPWMSDEDRWDEAFDYSVRLFSSLAGLVADHMASTIPGAETSLWFLRDMTDVYDMYILSFADVVQMHEGRPLLSGADFSVISYSQSFHRQVAICILSGMVVVLLRAAAITGKQPVVQLLKRAGCATPEHDLRKPIDAAFSLVFIEVPFLVLRFMASWNYGVPVSVMAVKNSLGILIDLYFIKRICCQKAESGDGGPPHAGAGGGSPDAV